MLNLNYRVWKKSSIEGDGFILTCASTTGNCGRRTRPNGRFISVQTFTYITKVIKDSTWGFYLNRPLPSSCSRYSKAVTF